MNYISEIRDLSAIRDNIRPRAYKFSLAAALKRMQARREEEKRQRELERIERASFFESLTNQSIQL